MVSSTRAGAAGRTRLGRYHLNQPLGGGPTGEVYRAKVYGVAGFEKQFAVKRFHPELLMDAGAAERIAAAARTYGSLEHPRIARLHEFGVAGGETFTAVELVEGLDTARLIAYVRDRRQPLSIGAGASLVAQAARAVGYAHGRGFSHLGLCPTNLLLTAEGEIKLTDFGFLPPRLPARPLDDPTLAARIPYLAPEQIAGEPTSAATDVFQLGLVAHELLAGRRPFEGASPFEVGQLILSGRPEEPPIARPLAQVLRRCLARSPFERFPDAGTLADALDAAVRAAMLGGDRRDLAEVVKGALSELERMNRQHISGTLEFPMPAPPTPTIVSGSGRVVTATPTLPDFPRQTIAGLGANELTPPAHLGRPGMPRPDSADEKTSEFESGLEMEVTLRRPAAPPKNPRPGLPPALDSPPPSLPSSPRPSLSLSPSPRPSPPPLSPSPRPSPPSPASARPSSTPSYAPSTSPPAATPPTASPPGAPPAALPPASLGPASLPSGRRDLGTPPPGPPPGPAGPTPAPSAESGSFPPGLAAPGLAEGPPPGSLESNPALEAGTAMRGRVWMEEAEQASAGSRRTGRKILSGLALLGVLGGLGAIGYFGYAYLSEQRSSGQAAGVGAALDAAPVAVATEVAAGASPSAELEAAEGDRDDEPEAAPDTLVIETVPEGARVYLDGSLVGRTPLELEASDDRHRLAVIKPGYKLHTDDIDGRGRLHLELDEVSPPGGPAGIKVRCRAKNRYVVFVNGHDVGQLCPTERIGVGRGDHEVEIYDPQTDSRRVFRVTVEDTRRSVRVRVD